jgi:hypothetical protein
MSTNKYPVGTKLRCGEILGIVVTNYKFLGDVCVNWEIDERSSYDEWWLDQFTKVVIDEG